VPKPSARQNATIRVLLVDDHEMILESLASALGSRPEIELVGSAASIRELQDLHAAHPDVVLMDYRLPDGTGADGCRLVKARWPDARVIILTGYDADGAALAAVTAGADGFLLKSGRVAVLVDAIHAAFAHQPVLSPAMLGVLAGRLSTPESGSPSKSLGDPEALTPRELTVLRALAKGRSTRAIADDLSLSQGTVRVYVEAIRRKFHVSSRLEAVSSAIAHHIVEIAPS
jgi:two-component system response regulator DevR